MQFKFPELLWALFLLLIPIFIHLLQLRRFKKTPFTNVKLLRRVVAKSRKSRTLKKWLLLLTRLLLFIALILAFAQPFFAKKTAFLKKEIVIYLDDSFSMQAKKDGNSLLNNAVQELIKSIPEEYSITLFTNEKVFENATISAIQNDLLTSTYSPKQLQLDEIFLKAGAFFQPGGETVQNTILISDFQQRMASSSLDSLGNTTTSWIQTLPDNVKNVSLDSIYVANEGSENLELVATLTADKETKDIPVSFFNKGELVAKTAALFDDNGQATVNFTIGNNEIIEGKLEIVDSGLIYDNQLFFNIDKKEKIKVLAIGPGDSQFLERIYTDDEFAFTSATLRTLDYSILEAQNLIVLNEITEIPSALSTGLRAFTDNGGWLTVIPAPDMDLDSYNLLSMGYFSTNYGQKINLPRNITTISFSHPLYRNVFEKDATNFQYPKVSSFYKINTLGPHILSFEDNTPFLFGRGGAFFFAASIASENSNFRNSPLIVPTLYNMGNNSLKLAELYMRMDEQIQVDIPLVLQKDEILKVSKSNYEFIPLQRSSANKVSILFQENPKTDGIYRIHKNGETIKHISFNYGRVESELNYLDLKAFGKSSDTYSVRSFFDTMEKDNSVTELWKWFVILAMLFLLVEVLIQKYFP
ncbi:BatA domain-containing protein [Ulvibacterium sp.]|uniref:BatA domain-containing protein n=1 Tax=Ulvibacterium sp. TaxID=2665914 RepID=UPI00260A7B95|nr:BatA domain-containing protein [Ulvibacterium sp.]